MAEQDAMELAYRDGRSAIDEVIAERLGVFAVIRLNRPRALNALSLPMIDTMRGLLKRWRDSDDVAGVILTSTTDRAFCAGGDVRAVRDAVLAARARGGAAESEPGRRYFESEYRLDRAIRAYRKPVIALADSITMGGGAGLSVNASHCIATDRTVFAMPETMIGFFPDVGATAFLNACPGAGGMALGLVGQRIDGMTMAHLGLARWLVNAQRLGALMEDLAGLELDAGSGRAAVDSSIERIISAHSTQDGPRPPADVWDQQFVDRHFSQASVEAILDSLAADESDGARATRVDLLSRSPTSLKVTFEAIRRARGLEFDDVIRQEFRISQRCIENKDFSEGVRSVLVDKDKNPRWSPPALREVSNEIVEAHFAGPAGGAMSFD